MTFINEKISEEDKARIDWAPYHIGLYRHSPFNPFMWTIDRDRDVFLVKIGKKIPGPQPDPEGYVLSWKGTLIRFFPKISLRIEPSEAKKDVYWEFDLPIPDALIAEKEKIQAALKEAIEAHGILYQGPDPLRNIHIQFVISNNSGKNV